MSWGRVLSSSAAVLAVAGGVVVAVAVSRQASTAAVDHPLPTVTQSSIPAVKTFPHVAPVSTPLPAAAAQRGTVTVTGPAASTTTPTPTPTAGRVSAPVVAPAEVHVSASPSTVAPARTAPARTASAAPAPAPVRHTSAAPVRVTARGGALPLRSSTGNATRVITVTARSSTSTVATLQAWTKAAGGGWQRHGGSVTAHIGADGMSAHASESRSATPIGSFTLTQAFGRYANPGTGLPYFTTTPADYWMSDEGPTYNTHQRCPSSDAGCHADGVNERLYYEVPYYRYAVVIDYNTRNAPGGVKAGRGSAFFLHVTDGTATAGCVAIPQQQLVSIMRWLTPSAHPRILIGTT